MSSNLRLEEIVTIANGISEWTKKPIDCGYSYSGTYTPNGSDKAVVVNTSVTRFWAPATWSGYRNDYVATLSFGDTTIVELTARQAKKSVLCS